MFCFIIFVKIKGWDSSTSDPDDDRAVIIDCLEFRLGRDGRDGMPGPPGPAGNEQTFVYLYSE